LGFKIQTSSDEKRPQETHKAIKLSAANAEEKYRHAFVAHLGGQQERVEKFQRKNEVQT